MVEKAHLSINVDDDVMERYRRRQRDYFSG
jgi:hypothetical protein